MCKAPPVSLLITISFGIDLALLVKTNSLILHFHAKQFSYLFYHQTQQPFYQKQELIVRITAPSFRNNHPNVFVFKDFNDWAFQVLF
jgi:hypothetical protein